MAKVKLYNVKAEEVGSLTVKDQVFKAEYNEGLVHEVVVAQQANLRQGTKSALTRSEVRGHAKKPFRQKHTGNARQGSTKGPHQTGGGVAFAPKPRDFSKKINKQAKRIALASALSAKFDAKEIVFLDEFKFAEAKTKLAQQFVDSFKLGKNNLVVVSKNDEIVTRATNNLPNVNLQLADCLSVSDVVINNKLFITKDAVKIIEEGFAE